MGPAGNPTRPIVAAIMPPPPALGASAGTIRDRDHDDRTETTMLGKTTQHVIVLSALLAVLAIIGLYAGIDAFIK
jgi:hypothetical protein